MAVFVHPQVKEARLQVCRQCPQLYIWLGLPRCRICSCFMNVKAKLAPFSCPLGYWGPVR